MELSPVRPIIIRLEEARKIAEAQDLDLVEISPNADPPVCKVIDYRKFLYEQKKKQKELKSKQQNVVVKEIRFGPNTDDHDFDFKLKHAFKFIEEGSKLKVFVFFSHCSPSLVGTKLLNLMVLENEISISYKLSFILFYF